MTEPQRSILYFDGVCNLCDGVVQFVIKRDKRKVFLFASLQSEAGQKAVDEAAQQGISADSVVLYKNGRYYIKSSAVLHTLTELGGMWKLANIAWVFPRVLRNVIYDWVARNRYRWFGKKDSCMIPTPELKSRFLD